MAIKSTKILQPLPPYKKSVYGLLREFRAKYRLPLAKKFELFKIQKFKFSGFRPKKINGYKINKNSPDSRILQKPSK
jgi:hypothetical protein